MHEQPSLFSVSDLPGTYKTRPALEMSATSLQAWKQRIFHFQQQVALQPIAQQESLFELALDPTPPADADRLNPFTLPQQNTEFWRWNDSAEGKGTAALYFVIDYTLPLLLYIGETVQSGQRWKGEHDCKRYLLNYRQAHYQTQQPSTLGIAFWSQAPAATRQRQQLESALIAKWRSPFNKENWHLWGTPFVSEK